MFLRVAGEEVEEGRGVVGHRLVGGEEAEVGVDEGRGRVVVAGAEVDVAADLLAFLANDHRQLAVGLEVHEAEHDVNAGAFHLPGPDDVVGLVEAGFELDERGDVFAIVGGFGEGFDDGAIAAGAIESLLDGQHVRIAGGLRDEFDDRREGIVRVVEQDVVLGDFGEDVGAVGEFGSAARDEGGLAEVGRSIRPTSSKRQVMSSGPVME